MTNLAEQNTSKEFSLVVEHSVPFRLQVKTIVSKFYFVSEEQLDRYASMGILVNVFLTLFGIAAGSSITCWATLFQNQLTVDNTITFVSVMWVSVVLGIIFLACAILLYSRQQQQKKKMFT